MVRRRDRRRNKGCSIVQYHPRPRARLSIISLMSTRRRAISDTTPRCGTMRRDPASDPGLLLLPEPVQGGEVEPLQRPVGIVAVQDGRGIVGEIMALETRTRALPPTARAGYAAAVRRAR